MKEETTKEAVAIEIIKVDRTDADVDNTAFYKKEPIDFTDGFGTKAVGLFNKVPIDVEALRQQVKEGEEAALVLAEIEKLK